MPSELAIQIYKSLWKQVADDYGGWSENRMLPLIDAAISPVLAENERLKMEIGLPPTTSHRCCE